MVNARAAQAPVKISPELFDLLNTALEYSRSDRRRLRHHVRERRLPLRLPAPGPPGRGADQGGAAGRELSARRARSGAAHGALHAARRAHRSRRHRQGAFGRPRHRDPAGARRPARPGHGRRRQPHRRRPLRQAVGRRHPPSGSQGGSDRTHSAGGRRDLHLRRLRALLRRGRRALSPHHRSRHRTLGEQGAQRDDHRADGDAHRRPVEDRVRARPRARAGNLQPPRTTSTRSS